MMMMTMIVMLLLMMMMKPMAHPNPTIIQEGEEGEGTKSQV